MIANATCPSHISNPYLLVVALWHSRTASTGSYLRLRSAIWDVYSLRTLSGGNACSRKPFRRGAPSGTLTERSLHIAFCTIVPSYHRTIELFIKTHTSLTPGSRQLVNSLLTSYKALGAVCFKPAACSLQSFSKA